ncbi:hypothetical protein GCWU000325_01649 [Alloprevotella tannerae ATCC 51259]|uniref:Uncharacterized protein n=1 Tax=Alloprevotella tannerae ATCC 51259 TaxID=626522 RepID=C9LHE6_9BACT|nr:hypothetical protein GCWU000325_01649 [Alloprevotella tannerae ATCC 51259]
MIGKTLSYVFTRYLLFNVFYCSLLLNDHDLLNRKFGTIVFVHYLCIVQ